MSNRLSPWARLFVWGIALMAATHAAADFPAHSVSGAFDHVAPALTVVSYSYEITNPATGQTRSSNSRALGVLVSPEGLVLARGHLSTDNVRPYNIRVTVREDDGETIYDASFVRKPDDVNVALLQIEGSGGEPFPHVTFASESGLSLGEPVLLFGVMGQTFDSAPSVTVRRVGTVLEEPRRTYALDDGVALGFVGGPAVNTAGEAVGVIGFDLSMGEGGDLYVRSGHPLIYQADLFERYIADPTAESPDRDRGEAWLGLFSQPLTDDLAEYWDLPREGGVVISTIVANSPAETAGLQRGDVITSFNGIPVRVRHDHEVVGFTKQVRNTPHGEPIPVTFLRDGEPRELTITLVERPRTAIDAEEYQDELFGLTVREITTDVRLALNLPTELQGVIVGHVRPGSWADLAQIRAGVIILRFGEHTIASIEDFQEAVERVAQEQPSEVAVFGRAGALTGFFRLEPKWGEDDSSSD